MDVRQVPHLGFTVPRTDQVLTSDQAYPPDLALNPPSLPIAHFLLKTSSPRQVIALITSTPGHPCNPLECGCCWSIIEHLSLPRIYWTHATSTGFSFGSIWTWFQNAEECCHCSRKPRSDNYYPSQFLTNTICGSAEDNYPSLFVTGVRTSARGKATLVSFAIVKALPLRSLLICYCFH